MKKQIKRVLAGVLAVATLCLATPISDIFSNPLTLKSAYTASAETYENLTYKIINGEISITDCSQSATEVVIPSEIEGLPVTSIGKNAFSYCSSLTSITIPSSVTSIGDSAFYVCSNLTSITIPDSVTSIGGWAFAICSSLTSITIPNSVTSIGYAAFSNCSSLTSITIPDSVTSIGGGALWGCSSLTSITIPDSVTSVGYGAFFGCSSLPSIIVDEDNQHYSDIDGVLFNKDKTNIISYPSGRTSKEYEIPDSVTSIGHYAFSHCSSLTSITIPDSVTSIGGAAFSWCESLASITIPDSVTSIGESAFYVCSNLTTITIPDSVTSIGCSAFSLCESLASITIPDSVTSIGEAAFSHCSSLTSIIVVEDNEYYSDIDGILFNKDKTNIISYPSGRTSKEYAIPDSVTSIGYWAFYDCSSLTSITIPSSVETIKSNSFDAKFLKTIYGYTGSAAETYANEKGITFIALDGEFETGDLSGDSVLDSGDITFIKQAIYGRKKLSPNQAKAADINGDGKLDVFDLALLKRDILK